MVKKGYNARYYDTSLPWLESSGSILKVNRLKTIMQPLKAYTELAVFKVYSNNTGLLISQFTEAEIQKIITGDIGIYKGVLFENIGTIILHHNHKELYYYQPSSQSEIDFVTEYEGNICPIEIKARRGNASSFRKFMEKYNCKLEFKFSSKNLHYDIDHHILYAPIYMREMIFEKRRNFFKPKPLIFFTFKTYCYFGKLYL